MAAPLRVRVREWLTDRSAFPTWHMKSEGDHPFGATFFRRKADFAGEASQNYSRAQVKECARLLTRAYTASGDNAAPEVAGLAGLSSEIGLALTAYRGH